MGEQSMGLGKLGAMDLTFKRKFRWTFKVQGTGVIGDVPEHYVKLAARPNISFEETEINFLNAKDWLPGKPSWETVTVTYMDVATQDLKPLYNWLASVYNFADPNPSIHDNMGSRRSDYSCQGTLTLFDGCGNPLEKWKLGNMWPQAINFGELDYSSSEEVTIELTLRYSQVAFRHLCPNYIPQANCTPCTGGATSPSPLTI